MKTFIGYDDQYQRPDLYTSHAITANGAGSAITTLPVTNLLDPRPSAVWGRSGVPQGGIVDIDILTTSNANAAERQTAAAVVVVDPYAIRVGTSERHAVNVRVRVGNFALSVNQYDATITGGAGFGFSSGRNKVSHAFVFAGRTRTVADMQAVNDGGVTYSGGGSHSAVRVTLTVPSTITGTYELRCARIMLMRGFYCSAAQGFDVDYNDESDVVRSYSGDPYVQVKPVKARMAAELIGIEEAQAFGTFPWRSNLHSVSKIAGRSGTVCFVRDLAASPLNGATLLTAPQSDADCIVGLLDAPIGIQHETLVEGPARSRYRGRLSITSSV